LPAGVFALGVASGDPLADRIMLWTRLASAPTAVDGGAPDGDVEVAFDVATDDAFEDLVASGIAIASPALGHSIHVDVTGLAPDTWFHYRFRASGQTSETGRTRTFPAADATPDRFRFVFASCQDLQWGRYPAWGRASEQPDLDAVVFLGDYIYEINLGDLSPTGDGSRVWAGPVPMTLADYRMRYAQTKADPQLQAAHLMAPWIVTFDDHEVSNNYAGDVGQADIDQPNSRDRRLAAYQAWYEHTPIRIDEVPDEPGPADFADLRVHRDFSFGSLARLFAIETRQHADPPACREGGDLLSDEGPLCPEAEDPARTNLGDEQESWLFDGLGATDAAWNVIANPLMLAELNVGTAEEPAFTRDAWSGYPAARQRLLGAIVDAKVPNPVVVTGDWHASFVLDVKAEADGPTVMPEFLASSISTIAFENDYRALNPQVRYFAVEHGYGLVTVTPEQLECEFHYVDDVWDADAPISRIDRWVVRDGEHEASAST
jgi:alkaline phosphatase D